MTAASSPALAEGERKKTLDSLYKFMAAGVFTKEEIRAMVKNVMGVSASTVPAAQPQTPEVPAAAVSPSVYKKCRKRKSSDADKKSLRQLVKNTTRRRFFDECCSLDSKLWYHGVGDKQFMHRLLFERAAQDVIDLLFANNPGRLRKVTEADVRRTVRVSSRNLFPVKGG